MVVRCAVVVVMCGCAREREAAPEDLDGLTRYLYQNWEDEELVGDAMENLGPWLRQTGTTEEAWEGYTLAPLTDEVVLDVGVPPGAVLAEAIGVALAGPSPYPVDDHAALLVLEDQTWNEPDSYTVYTREITEGDVGAFIDGEGLVRTVNTVDKSGSFGVNIAYTLHKDYRWATLDDGTRAVVGRSWVPDGGCSENGKNCVVQSYSIDLFYGPEAASTIRLMAGWNEITTEVDGLVGEDLLIAMMVSGNQDIYAATDAYLEAR
jgi:hypothetical protein